LAAGEQNVPFAFSVATTGDLRSPVIAFEENEMFANVHAEVLSGRK
jgi:hypothetical protein